MQYEYILEIYLPDSPKDLWQSFKSDRPFMAVGVGDFVNPAVWQDHGGPKKTPRVSKIEHLIVHIGDQITHKILIFTEP